MALFIQCTPHLILRLSKSMFGVLSFCCSELHLYSRCSSMLCSGVYPLLIFDNCWASILKIINNKFAGEGNLKDSSPRWICPCLYDCFTYWGWRENDQICPVFLLTAADNGNLWNSVQCFLSITGDIFHKWPTIGEIRKVGI